MSDLEMISACGKEMLTYLPGYYATSRIMQSNMEAQGSEMDMLLQALSETLNQNFVSTATWGLDLWERELGIVPPVGQPYDQRRSVIRSRIRGTGTVTVDLVKKVAEAYENGTVEVTQQSSLYQITIKFIDTIGLPPNKDDLKAAIESILPAHLAVTYTYRYLSISEVQSMTIDQIETHPLMDFAPFLDF